MDRPIRTAYPRLINLRQHDDLGRPRLGQELSRESGGTLTWLLGDRLGSVRAEYTSSGTLSTSYDYDPYGAPEGRTAPSDYGFTGEPYDGERGLVHLRARWYAPGHGKFLTRDPFPGLPTRPQSLLPYAYAENSPATLTDPTGECISNVLDDGSPFTWGSIALSTPPAAEPRAPRLKCGWKEVRLANGLVVRIWVCEPEEVTEQGRKQEQEEAELGCPWESNERLPRGVFSRNVFFNLVYGSGWLVQGRGPERSKISLMCHVNVEVQNGLGQSAINWHIYYDENIACPGDKCFRASNFTNTDPPNIRPDEFYPINTPAEVVSWPILADVESFLDTQHQGIVYMEMYSPLVRALQTLQLYEEEGPN